jgi:hypothetical protein
VPVGREADGVGSVAGSVLVLKLMLKSILLAMVNTESEIVDTATRMVDLHGRHDSAGMTGFEIVQGARRIVRRLSRRGPSAFPHMDK